MQKALQEYAEAFANHAQALSDEMRIKQTIKRTHYQLILAKESLKMLEWEILTDNERPQH